MKKTLIAMAVLAASGASFAQVTIYGTVDAGYVNVTGDNGSVTGISSSNSSSTKLGFTGTEDIGGGLKGLFKLEGGVALDSGIGSASNTNNQYGGTAAGNLSPGGTQGLTFQRYSYVGLAGNFGEVHLGREYTGVYIDVVGAADAFGTNGLADSANMTLNLGNTTQAAPTVTGASNAITYITPNMNGFTAKAQAWYGENRSSATNGTDGNGYGLVLKYSSGPLLAAYGVQNTKSTIAAATAPTGVAGNVGTAAAKGDYNQRALSLTYDFGAFKVGYSNVHEDIALTVGVDPTNNNSNLLSVSAPFGALTAKASYVRSVRNAPGAADITGTLYALGLDYSLSKRTTVYGIYGNVSQSGNTSGNTYAVKGLATSNLTSADAGSNGYAIGLKTTF